MRTVIDVLHEMSAERLAEISERSINLKYFLKLPMVMIVGLAGSVSALSILLMKISDTIVQNGDGADYWPELLLVIALVIYTGDTQL